MPLSILQLCAVDFTVQNFLRPLIRFLMEQGFNVTTACTKGAFFPSLEKEGFHMHPLPISRSMNLLKHASSAMRLYSHLRKKKYDIIHVHTPIASLIGRSAAWLARVPIKIYTAHGFYFHDDMPRVKRLFHINLERMGACFGDFIFTQSEEDRQTAIREKIVAPDRIVTIGNGVDLSRFDPDRIPSGEKQKRREEFQIPPDVPVVGMIGRMVREKGYGEFFTAAHAVLKEFPETRFLCIGDQLKSDYDASKKEFLDIIQKLGISSRVHFAGMRSDIPELLSILNVYTLPSYREGMPRSIIEAMAMGLPVVATNIRGCREEVVDGKTGYLVPRADARALANALLGILRAPHCARGLGEAGKIRARKIFSETAVLERQLEVYEKLISEKGLKDRR